MHIILTEQQHAALLARYPDDDILTSLKRTYTFDEARKYANDMLSRSSSKLEYVKQLRAATNIGLYDAVQIYNKLVGKSYWQNVVDQAI